MNERLAITPATRAPAQYTATNAATTDAAKLAA